MLVPSPHNFLRLSFCERTRSSFAEEASQSVSGWLGNLFREKVSSIQGLSDHLFPKGSPKHEGSALLAVPARKGSTSTP